MTGGTEDVCDRRLDSTPSGHLDFPAAAVQACWPHVSFAATKLPFVTSHTRPSAAGDRYISLAGRWRSSMLKQWQDRRLLSATSDRCGSAPEVGIQHRNAIGCAGNRIAGFAALLLRVENAVASRKPRPDLFFANIWCPMFWSRGNVTQQGCRPKTKLGVMNFAIIQVQLAQLGLSCRSIVTAPTTGGSSDEQVSTWVGQGGRTRGTSFMLYRNFGADWARGLCRYTIKI